MTIGERIKIRRKELGLTQEELAHRLGNKSRASVCTVENDKEDLTTTRIQQYADALECTPSYLMGWDEADKKAKQILDEYVTDNLSSDDRELLELYHIASPEAKAVVDFALKRNQQ